MDTWTPKKRSEVMALVRSKGNKSTELKLITLLKKHKISGWRRHFPLPGKPDFVFLTRKVAIFVDGDFWHGHPKRRIPISNREFWAHKIVTNRRRDRRIDRLLRKKEWIVLRIWESSLRRFPGRQVIRIQRALGVVSAS